MVRSTKVSYDRYIPEGPDLIMVIPTVLLCVSSVIIVKIKIFLHINWIAIE